MRFALLGPLEFVNGGGEQVSVGGARLRVLLAALLLHASEPVSPDALAEAVWDGSPPSGAAVTLRGHVLRLRRILGPEAGARITARDPGYVIHVAEHELDLLQFEAECRASAAALRAAAWAEASDAALRALGLWRAEPLLDVPSQALRDGFTPRFERLRVQVHEQRIEAELHLGRHDSLVPELRELIAAYPLRERLHAQLMLALARAGRQAEALTVYRDIRHLLIDELGIEPGPELRAVQERILAGDVALITPLSNPVPTGAAPRQLPAAVRHFVGRADELKALSNLIRQDGRPGGAVVTVVRGTAGIGKTALAIHWAHRHTERFPDGQLYVNLRGFDPSDAPLDPASVVRAFLDALAVPPARVPVDVEAQFALYRSRLSGTRTLIVLDNARDEGQVRPLLPGSAGCLALVTSRNQLSGLVALDGAIPITVGHLTRDESAELLALRIGRERVAQDVRATHALIDACARLPLALNIAAARAARHADTPLSALVQELLDTNQQLDLLSAGESAADVRAVFSWSYNTLNAHTARVFRLLGLYPGPDIGVTAAASIAGVGRDQGRRSLEQLAAAHLITETAQDRYSMHDLLRAYAAEQARTHETDRDRDAAVQRVLDHWLHAGCAAVDLVYPGLAGLDVGSPCPGVTLHEIIGRDDALRWYRTEHPALLGVVAMAAAAGFDSLAWRILWGWASYLDHRGRRRELETLSQIALGAAEHGADLLGQAFVHRWLGNTFGKQGSYADSHDHLRRSLALYKTLGDTARQGGTYYAIAVLFERQNRFADALRHAELARDLYRSADDVFGQAWALNAIGYYNTMRGNYQEAVSSCEEALGLALRIGSVDREAAILDSLGYAHHHLGHYSIAISHYKRVLDLLRANGDLQYQAETLTHLGDTHHATGDRAAARDAWQQAVTILDKLQRPGVDGLRAKLHDLDAHP